MSAGPPPRLVEGMRCHLDPGGLGELLECHVLAFLGPIVVLRPGAELVGTSAERLTDGVAGYLIVERDRRLHGLSGQFTLTGNLIAVRLTDPFRLGQRRACSRADVVLNARLMPLGAHGHAPVMTKTLDISPDGVRVHRPRDTMVWSRYQLILTGGTLEEPLFVECAPVRALPDSLGLHFLTIEPADRQRLMGLVLDRLNEGVMPVPSTA